MPTTPSRYWRENPQRYRMEAGECAGCGKVYFPPRRVCMECQGQEFKTVVLSRSYSRMLGRNSDETVR